MRGLLYAATAVLCIGLTIAAIATTIYHIPVMVAGTKVGEGTWTLWQVNAVTNSGGTTVAQNYDANSVPCEAQRADIQAAQAFYILTLLPLLAAVVIGVLDHFRLMPRLLLIVVAFGVFLLSIIGWATAIAFISAQWCAQQKISAVSDNGEWGPSPFLLLVVTLLSIPMMIVGWRVEPSKA